MITPGCDAIVKLAERYATIPVCREIYAEYPQSVDITRAPGCIICQAPEIQPFYLEEKNVQM